MTRLSNPMASAAMALITRRDRFQSRSCRAFTLTELLVVIGIVVMLISILLPSLSRARYCADLVKCQANLRSIAQAAMLHANDHKGYMPLCGYVFVASSGDGQGCTPTGIYDKAMRKYSYFMDGSQARPMDFPGSLAIYLNQRVRLDSRADLEADLATGTVARMFICPADRNFGAPGYALGEGQTSWRGPLCAQSYTYNEGVLGIADSTDNSGCSAPRQRAELTAVQCPGQTFLMADSANLRGGNVSTAGLFLIYNRQYNQTLGDVYNGNNCGDPVEYDRKRHRGRINISFCDGHVESRMISYADLAHVYLLRGNQ